MIHSQLELRPEQKTIDSIQDTLLRTLDAAGRWMQHNQNLDECIKAFNIAIRLDTDPKLFDAAAAMTFSSPFWVSALSADAKNSKGVQHLVDANIYSAMHIARALQSFPQEKRGYVDLGVGAGATVIETLRACENQGFQPAFTAGCDISAELLAIGKNRILQVFPTARPLLIPVKMSDFIASMADESLAGVTANYSLHHNPNPDSCFDALSRGAVTYRRDSYYYTPEFAKGNTDLSVPLPNFLSVLDGYVHGPIADLQQTIHEKGADMTAADLKGFIFRDSQLDILKTLRRKMHENGEVVHFDPSDGLSAFNKLHFSRALDRTNPNSLGSAAEIGVACFNNLESAKRRFFEAGFNVNEGFYQVRVGERLIRTSGNQSSPLTAGSTAETSEGPLVVDDVLGFGLRATPR